MPSPQRSIAGVVALAGGYPRHPRIDLLLVCMYQSALVRQAGRRTATRVRNLLRCDIKVIVQWFNRPPSLIVLIVQRPPRPPAVMNSDTLCELQGNRR